MVTGQLVLMDKGPVIPNNPKHAVMVYGILGMTPEEAARWCGDMQQRSVMSGSFHNTLILSDEVTPMPGWCRGGTPSTLLTSPIWRV